MEEIKLESKKYVDLFISTDLEMDELIEKEEHYQLSSYCYEQGFLAGALSESAKNFWFSQFLNGK